MNTLFIIFMKYSFTPANFHKLKKSDSPIYPLFAGSGCPKALSNDHFWWCYDQVLKAIAETVETVIWTIVYKPKKERNLLYNKKLRWSFLSSAANWQIRVDPRRQPSFSVHITSTRLHTDIILFSNSIKQVIIWKLTVLWEEYLKEAHE